MLKRRALRKIFITTFSLFTLFVLYVIPTKLNSNILNVEQEIIYTSNTTNQEIYLLGDNNYLVKFQIFLEENNLENNIQKVIRYLTKNSNEPIPNGLSGILPENTTVLGVHREGKIVTVNFSKELYNIEDTKEERMIEAIVYSLTSFSDIDGVSIQVEGNPLLTMPKSKKSLDPVLTREYGINKVYDITNRNGIQKVTVYYLDRISNNNYYVPVTKYLNDDREKIKIIIDSLASDYIHEANLMSYLNSKTTILDYEEKDNTFTLNLNSAVFGGDSILEEVEYTLSYSIFENYDVDKIYLKVDGELVRELEKGL